MQTNIQRESIVSLKFVFEHIYGPRFLSILKYVWMLYQTHILNMDLNFNSN